MSIVESKNKIYIIGGGVAGLTLAMFDPAFVVLTRTPLGQLDFPFNLGPRLLQRNEHTTDFFYKYANRLKLNTILDFAVTHIGYKSDQIIKNEANKRFKQEYSLITRGTTEYEDSFLSSSKNEIEHFILRGVDNSYKKFFELMLEYLISRNQLRFVTVVYVYPDKHIVKTDIGEFEYSHLVNTLNLKQFSMMFESQQCEQNINLSVKNKNFVITTNDQRDIAQSAHFSYIYSIDKDYTRKTLNGQYNCYEVEEELPKNQTQFDNRTILNKFSAPIQIVKSVDFKKIAGIHMLGRYAQWNHSIRFDTLFTEIRRIMGEIYG